MDKRGTAVNAAELSNKWASNSLYGELLAEMYNQFHNTEVNSEIVSGEHAYESFEPKVPYTVLYDMVDTLMIKFIKLYVALGMKPEDIWKFYYEKNRENFKRQQKNGRYEK